MITNIKQEKIIAPPPSIKITEEAEEVKIEKDEPT